MKRKLIEDLTKEDIENAAQIVGKRGLNRASWVVEVKGQEHALRPVLTQAQGLMPDDEFNQGKARKHLQRLGFQVTYKDKVVPVTA